MAGIEGITNVSWENITSIVSGPEPQDFLLRTNLIVYGGILYFALLLVLFVIIFVTAQKREDAIMHNLYYSSLITSVIGFFTRAVYSVYNGTIISMLTDKQVWIFPLLTIILGTILWASKRE